MPLILIAPMRRNSLALLRSGALRRIARGRISAAMLLSLTCVIPLPAKAQTKLTVAKVADDFALMMGDYGKELGLFQKLGLDVQLPDIPSTKAVQAMIGGSVDMALGGGSMITFAAKGAPFKAVAAIDGPPKMMVLVVPPQGKVKSIDDLQGSAVAATSKGSLTDWAITQIIEKKGWKESSIRRAYIGDTATEVAAMRAGVADAAVIDLATALELEQRGQGKILINFGEVITNYQNQMIYASDQFIKSNPDAVKRFLAGFFDTLAYARAHPEQTEAFAQKQLKISDSVARKVYELLMEPGFFSTDGRIERNILESMSKSFMESKVLDNQANLSSDVDQSFLPNGP